MMALDWPPRGAWRGRKGYCALIWRLGDKAMGEALPAGKWPSANGRHILTARSRADTADSGWHELVPFLVASQLVAMNAQLTADPEGSEPDHARFRA